MEATAFRFATGLSFLSSASLFSHSFSVGRIRTLAAISLPSVVFSPSPIRSMATQKPNSTSSTQIKASKKKSESNGRIMLLTRVEKLKLLSKAEKAGLLSAAEKLGLSLTAIEKLGLLSKAEGLGILSAATDPATPGSLQAVALGLLLLGPFCVYLVPDEQVWEIGLQVVVALVSVAGGSAAFGASSFVSSLQRSSS